MRFFNKLCSMRWPKPAGPELPPPQTIPTEQELEREREKKNRGATPEKE